MMTEPMVLEIAQKAGVTIRGHYDESGSTPQELARFAAIVNSAESELNLELARALSMLMDGIPFQFAGELEQKMAREALAKYKEWVTPNED